MPKQGENYPIRKHGCRKYTQDDIDAVIDLLQNTSYTFEKIAELTNTTFTFICDINNGKRSFINKDTINFPIRKNAKKPKISIELANKIIKELKKNDKSATQIGDEFNLPAYTIGSINRGKHSVCKKIPENYPIRKKAYRNKQNWSKRKINNIQLFEIVDLLLNTSLSTEEIAQRYMVHKTAIDRINRCTVFKPLLKYFKAPLRQNREYNNTVLNNR